MTRTGAARTDIALAPRGGRRECPAPVRKNASVACLLLAWLCANGAVWDFVQVVAWGRMFAGYATNMSVAAALKETFDPAKPCALCRTVSVAKSVEQKQAPAQAEQPAVKLDLACEVPAQLVFAVATEDWPLAREYSALTRAEAVPVPPPRA